MSRKKLSELINKKEGTWFACVAEVDGRIRDLVFQLLLLGIDHDSNCSVPRDWPYSIVGFFAAEC